MNDREELEEENARLRAELADVKLKEERWSRRVKELEARIDAAEAVLRGRR